MNICIYGAASPQLDQIYYEKTEELGRLMARRGHGLVFGGGETGLMGAAARGVDAEGGYLLGIAPRFFDEPGILYQHCTEFIMTETMRERKHLLEEKSQATIVVPGGIGTYEEFFDGGIFFNTVFYIFYLFISLYCTILLIFPTRSNVSTMVMIFNGIFI